MNPLLLTYATDRNRASWRGAGDAASPRPDPTQAAIASGVGAATAGVNVVTGYLHGQGNEETAETLYGIGSTALRQQTSQAINTAEATRILSVAAARLAHDQQQGVVAPQTSNPAQPSAPQSSSTGLIVLGVAGIGAAGAAWWYLRHKGR